MTAASDPAPPPERGWRRVHQLWHLHLDLRRERALIAALSFFLVFGGVRLLTLSIRSGVGPFHNVAVGGTHVHHLVWGILLLLLVGYLWLWEFGDGTNRRDRIVSRLTAIAWAAGAALTLDEFTLWLELKDNYWETTGQRNIDAALIFGSLIAAGLVARPLVHALAREGVTIARDIVRVEHRVVETVDRAVEEIHSAGRAE